MKNKLLIIFVVGFVSICSCKKAVQQQEQNIIIAIVTSGQWYVQSFQENGIDSTSAFSGYLFKFNQNGTVVASSGGVSATGSWTANISAKSITSTFQGATSPLSKLNGTWTITDSGLTYVVANSSINGVTENMRLQKQ
jgi:hypothetical protein